MPSANVTDVTDATFEATVMQSEIPVLVDFWATWCAPCKALNPHIDKVADDNPGRLRVVKLDVQRNLPTASRFGVSHLPALLLFKKGKMVGKLVGKVAGADIAKMVAPHMAA